MFRLLISVAAIALMASPALASPATATKALVEAKAIPELQAARARHHPR